MQTFKLSQGSRPLLISMPHRGIELPLDIRNKMTEEARLLADTDWHLEKLYDFAVELEVSIIAPQYSRYVIDLNRSPDNANLYPGANSTELCPTSTFASAPLYAPGAEPDTPEIARRLENYWQPYHRALQQELDRIKERHGIVVLFDAHSIRSQVPRFFEGQLPDLNIGTSGGSSCSAAMEVAALHALSGQKRYSAVVNQRFKGGYITRAYGHPEENIHALQLELSQCCYMDENPPFTYLPERARNIQAVLHKLVDTLLHWAETQ